MQVSRARELIKKSEAGLAALSKTEKVELESIIKKVEPTTRDRAITLKGVQTRAEFSREIERREIETEAIGSQSAASALNLRQEALQARQNVLKRLADRGLLQPGVATKFNADIEKLNKDIQKFNKSSQVTQKKITSFTKKEPTRTKETITKKQPTTFISAQSLTEQGAFGAPSPDITKGKISPVLKDVLQFGKSFEEGKKEAQEFAKFIGVRPSIVKEGFGFAGGLFNVPVSFGFKLTGAAVQQLIPKKARVEIPITTGAERLLLGAQQIPFVRGFLPFGISRQVGGESLVTLDRRQLAETAVLAGSFALPKVTKGVQKALRPGFLREPSFFPTKKPKLTPEQVRQVILEAVTDPLKPTRFPLTFEIKKPLTTGLKPVKPIKGGLPFLDPAGLIRRKPVKGKPLTLEDAGLIFKRPGKPKIFREKPLPFFKEFKPKVEKQVTITKAKVKPKKTKVKEVSIFEVSTEQLPRTTQRLRTRFFEDVQQRPLERFITREAQVPRTALLPRSLTFEAVATSTKQFLLEGDFQQQRTSQLERLLQARKQSQQNALTTLLGQTTAQRTRQVQKQSQLLEQLQKQFKTTIQKPKPFISTVTQPKTVTRPKVTVPVRPIPFLFDLPKREEQFPFIPTTTRKGGFNTFIRRRGKNVKVNKVPLTEGSAKGLGLLLADQSARRSGFIRKAKGRARRVPDLESVASTLAFKFRRPKGKTKLARDSFVERTRFAIDTPEELQGITLKGRIASERNRSIRKVLKSPKRKKLKRSKRKFKKQTRFFAF